MNNYSVVVEKETKNIRDKFSEIKNNNKTHILTNYYNNCEDDDTIWVLYGDNSIVFWDDDNGVIRVYFYSADKEELIDMLKCVPRDSCVEYLTKGKNVFEDIAYAADFEEEFVMHRYVSKMTEEEKEEHWKTIKELLYDPSLAQVAEATDLEVIYDKLKEIFNSRESHLCSRKELEQYIENKWVVVAKNADGRLIGLQIFKVEAGYRWYGYQIWSDNDPVVLANIEIVAKELYDEYIENIERNLGKTIKPLPRYAWVNRDNKIAVRNVKKEKCEFDGLCDYGYRKK